ncbi:hypothetical protein GH714_043481 [Hevea brasiliensis]|uniref:Uncharacterized protein n=1 Tax=Hevea brasiliensis TaxID=3981 RepID=A0A6A6K2W0_HEVBR|nr:hypothetical protein GH714_043481 [Hevea brasiliensis]
MDFTFTVKSAVDERTLAANPSSAERASFNFLYLQPMATIMTFPNHPRNAKLLYKECHGSRVLAVRCTACFNKAAHPFGQKLYSQCSYLYFAEPYRDKNFRKIAWQVRSSVDSGLDPSPSSSTSGGTRLTGDWDILSAAFAVAVVEGIGALMYRASFPLFNNIRSLITMFNYWKAGLSLGLFLDSFKYEIDDIMNFSNPFYFEMDIFPIFL